MADNASIKHSVKSSRHRCWHHLLKELEKESVSQRLRASTKGARLSLILEALERLYLQEYSCTA